MSDTTTLRGRLRAAMRHAGLNQTDLERRAKLSEGYLSRPLREERQRMNPEFLRRIAVACGVRAEWLSLGSGPMVEAGGQPANTTAPEQEAPSPMPARAVRDDALSPALRALYLAFRQGQHDPEDLEAIRRVVASGAALLDVENEEQAVQALYRWLVAAKHLRMAGRPVNFETVAWYLSTHDVPRAMAALDARSDALNAEASRELHALGAEPPAAPVMPPKTKR